MEIEIRNVSKKYGKKTVLDDMSLTVHGGECVGLVGGNGSGKSTLLGILAGVVASKGASFLCDGEELIDSARRAERVAYVPQGVPLFDELTAKDNLSLWYTKEKMKKELDGGVLGLLGVDGFLNVKVGRMSGGMKKRLAIGCAVHNSPSVLLLDEPSAALDLVCKENILSYLDGFRKRGGAVIIATHDVGEIAFCDRLYVLKDAHLTPHGFTGDVSELVSAL